MATTLVIHNSRDLDHAITKAFIFCGLTLVLMLGALGCAVFLAMKKTEVGPLLLVTSPFVLHSLQLLMTLVLLHMARKNPESITMAKCRWWSVISRIMTAPILIEMMILIGFKWYLTVIAIPLVVMYFVTILQVEKIMHYFFTRNLSSRIPNRGGGTTGADHHRELIFFEYPYDIDVNSSFYRLSATTGSPRNGPLQNNNRGSALSLALSLSLPIRNSPPPSYRDVTGGACGTHRTHHQIANCFHIPLVLNPTTPDSLGLDSPPPAYDTLGLEQKQETSQGQGGDQSKTEDGGGGQGSGTTNEKSNMKD